MANIKEAIAIVLDIGPNMSKLGEGATYLQQACHLITLILQRKLFSESKDEVMLILFGTDDSNNDLANKEGSYCHISIDKPLMPVTFEVVEQLKTFCKPELTHSADFVDALVVAMDALKTHTEDKKAFGAKRVILLSSLAESFSTQEVDDVIASMQEHAFAFTFLGPQVCHSEGMEVVEKIVEAVDGDQFTFNEVYPCLSSMQSRSIRPTAWKATLSIASSLSLPICMYTKVKEFKARSFSKVWMKDPNVPLKRSTTYHLPDSTHVDKEDIIEGNRYGSTLIPFSSEDQKEMALRTEKCFKVLGFTKTDNVKRHQFFGESVWVCMAEKDNKTAQVLFSSLMHALHESGMVAIVRRVYAGKSDVHVGCLMPSIKANSEFMYYIQLPFLEDVRQSSFRPLPLDPSSTSPYAFNEKQVDAVKGLIDSMNLSSKEKGGDDEEEYEEELEAGRVYNPYLQRLYQCMEHRALHPDDDSLPNIPAVISTLLQAPLSADDAIHTLQQLFPIQHHPKESSWGSGAVKGLQGGPTVKHDDGRAKELEQILSSGMLPPQQAFDSMLSIVRSFLIPPSFDLLRHCLTTMRAHHLNEGKYKYNDFMRLLKKSLVSFTPDFCSLLSEDKLGLVTMAEDAKSEVTEEEAKAFLSNGP